MVLRTPSSSRRQRTTRCSVDILPADGLLGRRAMRSISKAKASSFPLRSLRYMVYARTCSKLQFTTVKTLDQPSVEAMTFSSAISATKWCSRIQILARATNAQRSMVVQRHGPSLPVLETFLLPTTKCGIFRDHVVSCSIYFHKSILPLMQVTDKDRLRE